MSGPDIVLSANKTLAGFASLIPLAGAIFPFMPAAAVIHYSLVTALERSICSSFSLFALGTIPIYSITMRSFHTQFWPSFPVDGFL